MKSAHNGEKISSDVWYDLYCHECGGIFPRSSEHIRDRGCPICKGTLLYESINDIPTTDPWMVNYFPGGIEEAREYTRSSNKRVEFKCPFCGEIYPKALIINQLSKTHSLACKCCSTGIFYPERFMSSFLDSLGINYIPQVTCVQLPFADKYRYDFYLNEFNTIIETHGSQHLEEKGNNHFNLTLQEQQEIDSKKRDLAIKNGIGYYFEIDCRESTKNYIVNSIISSGLLELLNISSKDIDWDSCEVNARKNIIKEVCEYYKTHFEQILTIAEVFKININTVRHYLKLGNDNHWCVYNPKDKVTQNPGVVIYKNGEIFAYAKNLMYLSNHSKDILGIEMSKKGILKNLYGERNNKYGYSFKYTREPSICWELQNTGCLMIGGDGT